MKLLKRTIQWTIGIICGLYFCLQVAMHIPPVQRWAGSVASHVLHNLWDWEISIGRIRLGLLNRIIIDDINLKDKQDSTMLHVSRLAAKLEIIPLLDGKISIANTQLFGTEAYLYQRSAQEKPNFQFIIDTFKSDNTESKPVNLRIGNLVLRRIDVKWDRQWMPHKETGTFDPSHIHLQDIAMTARLKVLKTDSVNLSLKRLSFSEASGFELSNVLGEFSAGSNGAKLENFNIELPHTTLSIPSFMATWPDTPKGTDMKKWLGSTSWYAETAIHLTPSDFKAFAPRLANAHTPIELTSKVYGLEECINVPQLNLNNNGSLNLSAKLFINDYINTPEYTLEINRLQTNARLQHYITQELNGQAKEISPILTRLDTVNLSGQIKFSEESQSATLNLNNRLTDIRISSSARNWNQFKANITSPKIDLAKLLSDNGSHTLNHTSLDINASGVLKDKNGKPHINIHTILPLLCIQEREYRNLDIKTTLAGNTISVDAEGKDNEGEIRSHLTLTNGHRRHLQGTLQIENFLTERLGLGKMHPDARLSLNTEVNVSATDIDDIRGSLSISDFIVETDQQDSTIAHLTQFTLNTDIDAKGFRTLYIDSEPLKLDAQGHYRFSTLAATIQNTLHKRLPNLIEAKNIYARADDLQFALSLQDTVLLDRLGMKGVCIPERVHFYGSMHGNDSLDITAYIPFIKFGKEHLRNSSIRINGTKNDLTADVTTERLQKSGFITVYLKSSAHDNRLRLIAGADNKRKPAYKGEMDITANFARNTGGKREVNVWIAPTDLTISDTLWNVHPAMITWQDQHATIQGFRISTGGGSGRQRHYRRGIDINGLVSKNTEDSLKVNLHDINVAYILDIVNFKSVEFDGYASGTATASGLLSTPKATADIQVRNFMFNQAPLGTLKAQAEWGEQPHFLALAATIDDDSNNHHSIINGGFNIGNKEIGNGLDLKVNTKGFNLAFMNQFTEGILDDFQGRASGYCRIFGPFKAIDLEGDLMLDHAHVKMPMLGTQYHILRDSVHIRPGEIDIKATLLDEQASATILSKPYDNTYKNGNTQHTASLNGKFMHEHFKDLKFNFDAKVNNFLGYDFADFGESSFYATCLATGDISIRGIPGRLNIDINATPEAGTTFTYNVETPDALTEAKFITIKEREETDSTWLPSAHGQAKTDGGKTRTASASTTANETAPSSDIYMNFNLQITPDARMKLLMNRKSGDMIEILGSGRIMAKYHNKGRFNIYGTYRVQSGNYRLSIQDIIRKDFKFQPNGTITFGGDAMNADLNLKAVYSVNSVSLDDLTTSALGFSKTRVDCVMNLTGHPEQPIVTFDFDLPDASEDERQMVRSIVSTEEERNMQAIYLLGLGRFYNFDAEGEFQSSAAMNSLVSSTLSSQLNQFISDAVGSNNWTFGTSLKTGEDGWRNMDVEGMLSGRLFDNRLLLTGNFGYREKYYTQRNFISDVTVEYLLTKNGNISLKAYNQANDRYFVQSSLNTQGIGIQFKKDFNRISDLFFWQGKRKEQ